MLIKYKQILGYLLIATAMAIDSAINLDNYWLDVLIKVPKWIMILSFMRFRDWTEPEEYYSH